jgi:hypothetical protein
MNRFSSEKDRTATQSVGSYGQAIQRECWGCRKRKRDQGGRLHLKTRLWYCASCVAATAKPTQETNHG